MISTLPCLSLNTGFSFMERIENLLLVSIMESIVPSKIYPGYPGSK